MSASPKPKSKVITTTDAEYEKRDRRKSSYHLVASKNKLPNEPGDLEDDPLYEYLLSTSAEWGVSSGSCNPKVQDLKRRLILELARSDGDPETPEFQAVLNELTSAEDPATSFDARKKPKKESKCCGLEGMWINLSKVRSLTRSHIIGLRACCMMAPSSCIVTLSLWPSPAPRLFPPRLSHLRCFLYSLSTPTASERPGRPATSCTASAG
jgi:hypothetical protein